MVAHQEELTVGDRPRPVGLGVGRRLGLTVDRVEIGLAELMNGVLSCSHPAGGVNTTMSPRL